MTRALYIFNRRFVKSFEIFLGEAFVVSVIILCADNVTDCFVVFVNGNKAVFALFLYKIVAECVENEKFFFFV